MHLCIRREMLKMRTEEFLEKCGNKMYENILHFGESGDIAEPL